MLVFDFEERLGDVDTAERQRLELGVHSEPAHLVRQPARAARVTLGAGAVNALRVVLAQDALDSMVDSLARRVVARFSGRAREPDRRCEHGPVGILHEVPARQTAVVDAPPWLLLRMRIDDRDGSKSHLAQISNEPVGMLKILFHRETLQILGVHCFGAQASEIVHIGQAIMNQPGELNTLKYFINTTFNYPTMAEAYRVAAFDGLNRIF